MRGLADHLNQRGLVALAPANPAPRLPLWLILGWTLLTAHGALASQLLLPDLSDAGRWTAPTGQAVVAAAEPAPGSIRAIEWSLDVDWSRPNGCQIECVGLDILPADVFMLQVKPSAPYLNVTLTDLDGTVAFASRVGLTAGAWQQVSLPLTPESQKEMGESLIEAPRIMASGADGKLGRIQKVALGMDHRAGEFWGHKRVTYAFGDFRVRLLDSPELRDLLKTAAARVTEKLDQAQAKLNALDAAIDAAQAAGLDTAFAQAASVVAAHTIQWAQMDADYALEHGAPLFMADAERQADYLLESLSRAFADLQVVMQKGAPAVPAADMRKITTRKGNFNAADRPVIITGVQSPVFGYEATRRAGFNGVSQHEFGVGNVVNQDGTINAEAVRSVVGQAKDAADHNLAFDQLLTLHGLPEWAYEQHADMDPGGFRRARNPFMPWNVDSEGFRTLVDKFLSAGIPALAECPNIASYDLVNELWYAEHNDYPPAAWQEFLKRRYGDLGTLNTAWGANFGHWDEIAGQVDNPIAHADFAAYNAERVARFVEWAAGRVRQHDRDTPCYVKVHGGGVEAIGADKELLAKVLDAQGADCFPEPKFTPDGVEADFWTQAMILDLYRSLADKPIIDSEYHVVSYVPYEAVKDVSGDFVRAMLWQGALHGRDAAYIWIAQRRGACPWVPYESDDGSPHGDHLFLTLPWAFEAAARTAIELERCAEAICRFQEQQAEVALLYAGPDVRDTYQALYFLDAPFRFVTDAQIRAGALEEAGIKLLVVPSRAPISEEAFQNVLEFAMGGGTVTVGEGAFTQDEYGRPRELARIPRPGAIRILRTSAEGPALDKPLAADLDGLYDAARVRRPFRAAPAGVEPRPGPPQRRRVPGVELRAERTGPDWLVYLINFNPKPVKVKLDGLREDAALVSLLDGAGVSPTLTLEPLQPLLIRVQRRGAGPPA
jgi:hypothetical protein